MATQAEARDRIIKELLHDDAALSREEAEALYAEATQNTFAARFAALGIILPVLEQAGEPGEISDAAGKNVLQVDPMGMLDDDKVSAIAALVVNAINISGDVSHADPR
ncbi:MAG: hypothetical protein KL863_09090 [Rhizobium sp.]|nr:hypothetical protein [Rhizobium sp.]